MGAHFCRGANGVAPPAAHPSIRSLASQAVIFATSLENNDEIDNTAIIPSDRTYPCW